MSIQRKTKRQGKLFIRIFPDKPFTKKPLETRMGTGKGGVEDWVAGQGRAACSTRSKA